MLKHKITGNALQTLTCQLDPGQTIYGEPGKFLWKTQNVTLETRLSAPAGGTGQAAPPQGGRGGGLLAKAMDVGKRVLAGEHLAFEYFTSTGGSGLVGFAGAVPGELRVLELDGSGGWLTERGAFVAAEAGVTFDIAFTGLRAGLRGGEGFVLERFSGSGSLVIAAAGNFIELDPADYGGVLQVHTGCIVAFQDSLRYDIQRLGGGIGQMVMNSALGEGSVVASISGTGKVLIQTVTLHALAETLARHNPRGQSGETKGGLAAALSDFR